VLVEGVFENEADGAKNVEGVAAVFYTHDY